MKDYLSTLQKSAKIKIFHKVESQGQNLLFTLFSQKSTATFNGDRDKTPCYTD
jgi:hypothetical protein